VKRVRPNSGLKLQFSAIAIAVSVAVAVVCLIALLVWQHYRTALEAGIVRAQSAAQVVAAHAEWMLEASDQALRRIDSAIGESPIRASVGTIEDISQAVGDLPPGFQYSVYDETGMLRLSSVDEAVGINVQDRDYFKRLLAGETVVISPQLEERLSGEQVFVIARRISRGGGFHGAASIAIPTVSMHAFWSALELGPKSTVALILSDGWLMARQPQLAEAVNISASSMFTDYPDGEQSGAYESAVSPVDGASRLVAFYRVDGWPVIATTGLDRGEALESFWRSLWVGALFGLPLVVLICAGTTWIYRLLNAEAAARRELESQRTALEEALERNRVLMREIHHRVKNNLQAVNSLIRLQHLPPDIADDLDGRISAMVAVHEQIYGNDQFEHIDMASYVSMLLEQITTGYGKDVQVKTSLKSVMLDRDRAMPFGLLLNEIVSNSFKHAFNDMPDGKGILEISLIEEAGEIRLVVADNGMGSASADGHRGMGSRLVEAFVAQLHGRINVDHAEGTKTTLIIPARPEGS